MTGVSDRRGARIAILLCLVGSVAVLTAVGRTWERQETTVRTPTPQRPDAFVSSVDTRTGAELAPALRALGLVSLAGTAALVGTRGQARRAVGVVLVLTGAACAVVAMRTRGVGAGPWVAVVGATAVAAAGAAAVAHSGSWASLGTTYDAPSTPVARDELGEAWKSVDRGEEPR